MIYRLLLFLSLFSSACYAETIPATSYAPGSDIVDADYRFRTTISTDYDSFSTACNTWRSLNSKTLGSCTDNQTSSSLTQDTLLGTCAYWAGYCASYNGVYRKNVCPANYTAVDSTVVTCQNTVTVYKCPSGQNWTLSGSNCTRPDCLSGQSRNAFGVCESLCSTGASAGYYPSTNGESNCRSDGCKVSRSAGGQSSSCTGWSDTAGWSSCWMAMDGTHCTPSSGAPDAPVNNNRCPPNQSSVTVSGVTTCVPATGRTDNRETKTETTTNDAGGVTTKETTITTSGNSDGTTSTTTTIKTTNPDGSITTTSSGTSNTNATPVGSAVGETPEDLNDVLRACSERPDLPICQDYCSKPENFDKLACMSTSTPAEETALDTKEMSPSNFTEESYGGGSASCPAPIDVAYGIKVDFQMICDALAMIKPMFLAMAYIIAGLIVLGGLRSQ